MTAKEAYTQAIEKVLGFFLTESPNWKADVRTPKEDTGGWVKGKPDALLVIYTENGIMNPLHSDWGTGFERWQQVDKMACELTGKRLHSEPNNGAVITVWED